MDCCQTGLKKDTFQSFLAEEKGANRLSGDSEFNRAPTSWCAAGSKLEKSH